MAAATHRLRTVLRVLGGLLAGVIVLGVVAVGALLLTLRSDWGHGKILHAVLPLAKKAVIGELRIGALDGDFTHRLELRDVELRDREGQLVARVPSLAIRYNLLALISRTLSITSVNLTAEVSARYLSDGQLNLGTLLAPSPPHNNPLPIQIAVSGIAAQVAVHYDVPPVPLARPIPPVDARLQLAGGIRIARDMSMKVQVQSLAVQVKAPAAAELQVKGNVDITGSQIALQPLQLGVSTTGAEVNRLAPAARLRGNFDLQAQVDGTLDQLHAQLDIKLPAGVVHAKVKVSPQAAQLPWELILAVRDFDAGALRADIPRTQIQLELTALGEGPSGRLELHRLQVTAADNSAQLSGWVEAPPGLFASGDWLAARGDLTLNIAAFHLVELARVGFPALGGSLSGITRAQLAGRSVHLMTATAGQSLRGFGAAIERLDLNMDAVDLRGQVKLLVHNLRVAKQHFAKIELAAQGKRELVHLKVAGQGPEQVAFRFALAARPEYLPGSPDTGSLALRGLDADLQELLLTRAAQKLALVRPARLHLNLADGPVIDVEHFGLAFADQRFTLDGHYETQSERLRGKLVALNLDVRKLAKLFSPQSDLPDTRIDVRAQVGGTPKALIGHVAVDAQIGTSKSVPLPPSVAQITADLQDQRVRGELSLKPQGPGDGPRVSAHFAAPLSGHGALHLDANAQAQLQTFQDLLPQAARNLHLKGAVALQVAAEGTLQRPELTLRVTLPAWHSDWGGGKNTTLAVDYKQLQLSTKLGSQFVTPEGQPLGAVQLTAQAPLQVGVGVTGAQVVHQLKTGASSADFALTGLDLPKLWKAVRAEQAPIRGGLVDAKLQFHGPLLAGPHSPTLALQIDGHELDYAGNKDLPAVKGAAGITLAYKADQAVLDLNAALDGKPLLKGHGETKVRVGDLVSGGAQMVQQLPITATLEVLPMELPAALPVHGQVAVTIKAHGTVADPQAVLDLSTAKLRIQEWAVGEVRAHATLDRQHGGKADIQINPGPGQPGQIQLSAVVPLPLDLQSPALRVELKAHGYRIDYKPPEQDTQILVSGGGNGLRLAKGELEADLEVHGGKPLPVASGFLKLGKGEFAASVVPQVFRDITVDLQVDNNGLFTLHKAAMNAEGGTLNASGTAKLDGLILRKVGLKASARRFPVAAGPLGLWLDSDVEVQAETKGDTLEGKVTVARTTVTLPKLESARSVQPLGPLEDIKLVDAAARQTAAKKAEVAQKKEDKPAAPPGTLPIHTHIKVEIPSSIAVVGPEVKADLIGHLDLRLNGPKNVPIITGEIHSLTGWVQLFKKHYELDRAQVSLSGESPPNPLIDVQISTDMQDVTVRIRVSGTAKKPRIRMSSDPSIYDESQIIVLVLAGGRQGGGGLEQKVVGGLSSLLIGQLQDQLAGSLPIDVIRFDLGSSDPMSTNRTSLEVGKYIRDDLFLLYTHRFGSSLNTLHRTNNDEVTLEWHFKQNYQVDLMAGDQGMGSLNLYWLKRF